MWSQVEVHRPRCLGLHNVYRDLR